MPILHFCYPFSTNESWTFTDPHHVNICRLRDEDTESGKGASLPQSPHSMSAAAAAAIRGSSGPRSVDSDFEDSRPDYRSLPDVALSLCGHFGDQLDPPEELFLQSLVTYDDFVENPRLIENPDLLVRIGGKYYTWQAACPIVMSWVLYQRFLPQSSVDAIVHEFMPKREEKKTEPVPARSSWFPWGRKAQPKRENSDIGSTNSITVQSESSGSVNAIKTTEQVTTQETVNPIVRESLRDLPMTATSSDNESNDSNQESGKKLPMERRPYYENTDVFCKTLRLTTEQIVN